MPITLLPALLILAACSPPEVAGGNDDAVTTLALAAAPGSMGPNLASGPDGTIVLSWIEPGAEGHALRYSSLVNDTWTSPRTVASGKNWFVNWADFPSVVPVSDVLWGAHWLVSQEAGGYAYDIHAAVSADAGDTWSDTIIPHNDGTDTEHGFVSLFPDSAGLGMVWLDGRKMVNDYDETDKLASGMTLRSGTFGTDLLPYKDALVDDLVCDCCQTDIAVTNDGPVAVYRNRTIDEIRDIYVSRRESGEWQPGIAVNDDHWEIDACPVNGPVIKAQRSTVVVAWFTAPNESPRVRVAWSDDSGRSFGEAIDVSGDRPLGHVGSALLPNGNLALSWLRSTGQGGAELLLTLVSPSGDVAPPFVVESAVDVFAFSVPQLGLHGDKLLVAWTTETGGTFGVASALIPTRLLANE